MCNSNGSVRGKSCDCQICRMDNSMKTVDLWGTPAEQFNEDNATVVELLDKEAATHEINSHMILDHLDGNYL